MNSSTKAESKKDKKKKKSKKKHSKVKQPEEDNVQAKVLKNEVDQIAEIMVSNIDKMLDRGDNLDLLMTNAEELEAQAKGFQVVSRKVKKKYLWSYRKTTIILVVVIAFILIAIVGIVLLVVKPW